MNPRKTDGHCLQYAIVGGAIVLDTALLDDEAVMKLIHDNPVKYGRNVGIGVYRFNRSPLCEAWTTMGRRLRTEIDCPAIQEAARRKDKAVTPLQDWGEQ